MSTHCHITNRIKTNEGHTLLSLSIPNPKTFTKQLTIRYALDEAKSRLPVQYHSLFDEAISHYQIASENLKKVAELFPCFSVTEEQGVANVKDKNLCRRAIDCLKLAREAEMAVLGCLGRIVGGL